MFLMRWVHVGNLECNLSSYDRGQAEFERYFLFQHNFYTNAFSQRLLNCVVPSKNNFLEDLQGNYLIQSFSAKNFLKFFNKKKLLEAKSLL